MKHGKGFPIAKFAIFLLFSYSSAQGAEGNRLSHLDEPNNPWQFNRQSAKLITPQWIGEDGVEAVAVLAIDDMSGDGQNFRNYLTPIIKRLKRIDGRGPVSITCNRPEPDHPNMQWFFEQGVSLETHTLTHPCPLLQRYDFRRARANYHGCVDLLTLIPNNRSVGFRFPCMDGQNTPSPRAYAEILNGVSDLGNFMTSSTSVGVLFTPDDPEVPKSIFDDDPGGARRFSKYLMNGFVNYVENYPYPFVIGNLIWELPFVYPNDYTGQALHGSQNPITISDFKAAVDVTVAKKGAVSLCFHAGGWMSSEQMADIVDHSDKTHGKKVKFLNMREMDERIVENMLMGHALRRADGGDNGVRVFDINGDGFMDVLIANKKAKLTRLWNPERGKWRNIPFPVALDHDLRFGILDKSVNPVAVSPKTGWRFSGEAWVEDKTLAANQSGFRLLDINNDGNSELISNNSIKRRIEGAWESCSFKLPKQTAIEREDGGDAGMRFADIDDDGNQDVIFSNGDRFGTWIFESMEKGWTRRGLYGERENNGVGENHPRGRNALPPIVRADGTNNGAWIKRGHLYWQNEDTGAVMSHHIDQRSFGDLMGDQVNYPRSARASLRAMQPRPGFRVELVAAEPLVMDPVDVAWGPDGTMWVVEMADYPMGIDNKDKPGSRVAALTDTDGDGKYDKRTLFADGLETASTVLPWRDGVLVVAPPSVWFLKDTTGDGKADQKEVLYEGFGRGNEQHRGNGLVWGLDGWLYVANGDSGGTIRSTRSGKKLNLGGFDLRIRPDTGELEPATGVTQHGRNRDDWGNWVAGNNSSGWQIALEDHDIRKNPKVSQPSNRHGINGVIDLYPISQVLSHYSGYRAPPAGSPGKLTSGCGYTFYRDSLFDGIIEPSVYYSCPVHNCVHREVISWDGVLMNTERASDEARSEFLRSSDSWFRPASIRTGPDGAMYVADLYRLVIEHPEWIDDTLEREMIADGRLRAGHDKGRIYKIFPESAKLHESATLAGKEPDELANLMDSPNGWQRDTAHMMLTWLEKGEQTKAVSNLHKVVNSKYPAARAQALSALADLASLSVKAMHSGLGDEHAGVRRNALRVGGDLFNSDEKLGEKAVSLLDDEDAHVQRRAAYALGQWKDSRAGQALGRFLVKNADRPYLRAAALTSAGSFPDEVLISVLSMKRTPITVGLGTEIMGMLGDDAKKFVPPVIARIAVKPPKGQQYEAWKLIAATRLLEAVGGDAELKSMIAPMLNGARDIVMNESQDLTSRLASVQLIEKAAPKAKEDIEPLSSLLKLTTPVELQVAVAKSLLRHEDTGAAPKILAGWSEHGPTLRSAIIDSLLARSKLTDLLMDSIAENNELATSIDVSRRQLLLNHENESIRKRSGELFGGATRPDRAAVMKEYEVSLSEDGDRDKGRTVFGKVCASCHRLDGVGKVVGPNLAGLNNRAPATYLTAIIDPNRAVEAKWMMFVAKTKKGLTLAGSVAEETSSAITLAGVDGSRTSISRSDLKSLESTGRSLMPEGLETAITPSEMTHLLAYLRSTGRPFKQAVVKGNTIEHLSADHDGFYSINFDPVPGATGIELEWNNAGDFKHWTIREIEAYANFDSMVDIVGGTVVPGPVRTVDNVFTNAFDGDPKTWTYQTQPYTNKAPQRTLLDLEPGAHTLDRIRINDVAGNDANGRMQQITVRVTTDKASDVKARKYVDVTNVSVQIFGEVENQVSTKEKEPEPSGPFRGKAQSIPGKVEMEHYDEGEPGTAYKDVDANNLGADYRKNTQVDIEKRADASNGHGIGWIKAGEWLNYSVEIAETGTYDIKIPVASQKEGGLFHLEVEGKDLTGPIRLIDTGSWTQLKTVTHKGIKLKKGSHVIRVVMDEDGKTGYVGDIDCMIFNRSN